MNPPPYKRLTRARYRWESPVVVSPRSSLWLGSDHLLLVEFRDRVGFRESYKRFYFRDIQAFTVLQTTRRTVWNVVLAILLAPCLIGIAVSLAQEANWVVVILWSVPTVILSVPIIANSLLGATCAVKIRTAVQTEDLPSLNRVRQTNRILTRIRPLIAEAQGLITGDEVSAQMRVAADNLGAFGRPAPSFTPPASSS